MIMHLELWCATGTDVRYDVRTYVVFLEKRGHHVPVISFFFPPGVLHAMGGREGNDVCRICHNSADGLPHTGGKVSHCLFFPGQMLADVRFGEG
jgi:hypothetical protein